MVGVERPLLCRDAGVCSGLGGAGTVQGTVKDPTGGVMVAVTVTISNAVTGFTRSTTTDGAGKFVLRNLAPNNYHVEVTAQGFQTLARDVDVRSGVPLELELTLTLAGATTSVEVKGHTEELAERDPTAHVDIDQNVINQLPIEASGGITSVIDADLARRRRRRPTASSIRWGITPRRSSRLTTSRSPTNRAGSIRTSCRPMPSSRSRSCRAWRRPNTATRAA